MQQRAMEQDEHDDSEDIERTHDETQTERRETAGSETSRPRADETVGQARLFPPDATKEAWTRWESIQVGFVDHPQQSVREADQLVADVMGTLTDTFSRERADLEGQWDRGEEVSTEDLRVALQRYRSFFERLLAA